MQGAGTTANEVRGNYIGTDVTGTQPVGKALPAFDHLWRQP